MTPSTPRHRTRPKQFDAAAAALPENRSVPLEQMNAEEIDRWLEAGGEYLEPARELMADAVQAAPEPAEPSENEIFQSLLREYSPQGVVELAWCRDIARNLHHATRLRSLRTSYLNSIGSKGLTRKAIADAMPTSFNPAVSDMYIDRVLPLLLGGPEAAEQQGRLGEYRNIASELKEYGLDLDQLQASTYFAEIYKFESIEKMIVLTDTRRDNIVRDLEKRQSAREGRRQLLSNSPPIE